MRYQITQDRTFSHSRAARRNCANAATSVPAATVALFSQKLKEAADRRRQELRQARQALQNAKQEVQEIRNRLAAAKPEALELKNFARRTQLASQNPERLLMVAA